MPESVFTHTIPLDLADWICPGVAFFTGAVDSSTLPPVVAGGTKDWDGTSVADFLDFFGFLPVSAGVVAVDGVSVDAADGVPVEAADGDSVDLADFFFFLVLVV